MDKVLVKVTAKGEEIYRGTYDIEIEKQGEIERVLSLAMEESKALRSYQMNGDLGLQICPA